MLTFLEYLEEQKRNVNMTARDLETAAREIGYQPVGGKEHEKWKHPLSPHVVVIPRHRGDLSPGVVSKEMKKIELTKQIVASSQMGDIPPHLQLRIRSRHNE